MAVQLIRNCTVGWQAITATSQDIRQSTCSCRKRCCMVRCSTVLVLSPKHDQYQCLNCHHCLTVVCAPAAVAGSLRVVWWHEAPVLCSWHLPTSLPATFWLSRAVQTCSVVTTKGRKSKRGAVCTPTIVVCCVGRTIRLALVCLHRADEYKADTHF